MEAEIIKLGLTQGIFCALFLWLFFDTRKDTKKREESYQKTISENQNIIVRLTEKFNIVDGIKDDVDEIKDKIFR